MPSSSSTSSTKAKTRRFRFGTSRMRHSNGCHTCRIRMKSNAREEIKRRIQHHLNQYPVPRGLGPHPERPYLDFTDLTEKDDSRRNQSQEEHDQPAGLDQPQQVSPALLPSRTEHPSQAPSPSSSEPRGLMCGVITRWPSPGFPSYYSPPFLPTYSDDLFSPDGETINPRGIINQGIFYSHESAADHNPQNAIFLPAPMVYDRYSFDDSSSRHPIYAWGPGIYRPTRQSSPQTEARPNTEHVKSWYAAYLGLLHGSSSRRVLPLELVLYICHLAGFERWHSKVAPEGRKGVYEWDAQVQSLVWFQTEPFTKQMLSRTKSVQLVTRLDSGSSTANQSAGWFELQVARPVEEDPALSKVTRRPNGDEVSWCSHKNTDAATTQPQGLVERKGTVFGPDHELWSQIGDGDVIQVVVKAPVFTRCETASNGILRISTWWEPSSEMMVLFDKRSA
ncbi:unnamed protein product [Rhizoctonia solani]|uniref:Uncharacterized protein n=1 Tax=Rhizoctonia solani TaxID=456999 RepID=A0A8H3BS15_9AGAM|nr:unnamed protein product [Rhizoctonia solani]